MNPYSFSLSVSLLTRATLKKSLKINTTGKRQLDTVLYVMYNF